MTSPAGVKLFSRSDNPYPGDNDKMSVVSDSVTSTPAKSTPQDAAQNHTAPLKGKGPLLEEPDVQKVAKKLVGLWTRQDVPMNRRDAYWEQFAEWRRGMRGIFVQKFEDRNEWRVYRVPGMSSRPMPDKTDELVQRTVANLMADDPVPACEPEQDTPDAIDAAEFEERILKAETGESLLDLPRVLRNALNKAGTYCSAFLWFTVDPHGKGYEPELRMADPNATDASQPACLLDPQTGQLSASPVIRFVAADGTTLTDDPQQAKRNWKPGLKIDILTGRNFRFLPETSKDDKDADGMLIARYTTKGAMKSAFPVTLGYDDAKWKKLAEWKLPKSKRLLPRWARDYLTRAKDQNVLSVGDQVPDDTPILTLTGYYKDTTDYSDGAYLVVGQDEVFYRDTHYGTYTKADGTKEGECLMLPVAQLRWWDDSEEDDPYGRTVVEKLGPWDEVYGTQLSSELDWAFRFNNPNVYMTAGGPVQAKMLAKRDGTPIIVQTKEDMPTYEVVPPWPSTSRELRDDAREAMNQSAGLLATGSGSAQENTLGNSGKQADTIVAQSGVNLSNVRDNVSSCYVRSLQIIAQLMKVYYTTPDKVSYVGEDGGFKEEEWDGSDISGKTIRLARGSLTGLSPQAKQAYIAQALTMGLDPHEGLRLMNSSLSGELGAQDNPYVLRVRRQITRWLKGPDADVSEQNPKGTWDAQAQAYGQALAQQQAQQPPQQPPQNGAPPVPAQPQAPLPPQPYTPFDALPIDDEQAIAVLRHQELSRGMVRAKFSKFSGAWKQLYLDEHQKARQAAGIYTVDEQMQHAQAAQAATTNASIQIEQAKETAKTQGELAHTQAKTQGETQKSTQDIYNELKADIIMAITNAAVNPKVQAPPADQVEAGVLKGDANALSIPVQNESTPTPVRRLTRADG